MNSSKAFCPPCRPLNSCFPFRGVRPRSFMIATYPKTIPSFLDIRIRQLSMALYSIIRKPFGLNRRLLLSLARSVVCCCWSNRNLYCGLAIKNESKGIDCRDGPVEVCGADRGSILDNKKGAHYERLSCRRVYVG